MSIVATCMHDGNKAAAGRSARSAAGIGQAGFFEDGKRVHIAAEHHDRAGAVFQDADDAGLANAGVRLVAEAFELHGDECGGFHFLKAELGVGMEVLEDFEEALFILVNEGRDLLGEVGGRFFLGRQRCGEEQGSEEQRQRE